MCDFNQFRSCICVDNLDIKQELFTRSKRGFEEDFSLAFTQYVLSNNKKNDEEKSINISPVCLLVLIHNYCTSI